MKTLQNPTTFFFRQAEHVENHSNKEIDDFVKKLLNKDACPLCMENYDLIVRLPRIMIHCGHTFCTSCLKQFFMNRRVRCPMCLKLVKQLDKLERLPINHTIYTHLVQKDKKTCEKTNLKPLVQDAAKTLFSEFQKSQKQALMKQNPQKIDPDSGLPFCVFHPDRVQHFYCATHSSAGCRVCSEIGHSKAECKVIDLYEIEDPNQLTQMVTKNKPQTHILQKQNQDDESSQNNFQNDGIVSLNPKGIGKQRIIDLGTADRIDAGSFNQLNLDDDIDVKYLDQNYEDEDQDDDQDEE